MKAILDKLSSKEIRQLHNKIGISFDDLAKIIGTYKSTLIWWEYDKSIPVNNYQIILKTIKKYPKVLYYLLYANKEQFSDKQFNRILRKIEKYAGSKDEVDDLI